MASSAQALLRVCSHLCMPAGGVLAGALAAALTRERGEQAGSAHRRALAAHVATLFCVQLARTLYVFDVIKCSDAVPVQNYIEISAYCWLHTICINFALSFRNHNSAEGYANLLFGLAYAWCTPMVLLITIERQVEGKWLAFPSHLYDIKTCVEEEDSLLLVKRKDISLHLGIQRGITILITSCFFLYLSFKTNYQKKRALLCQEDAASMTDVISRQRQAMKYILAMVATGVVEVTLDVAAWYCGYRYAANNALIAYLQPAPTTNAIADAIAHANADANASFLLAKLITLSVSLGIDFIRSLLVLELVWWGGPGGREATGNADEDSLPPYELAMNMPRPSAAASHALSALASPPPPPYSALFGRRRLAEDEAALLDSPPPSPSPTPSPPPSFRSLHLPAPLALPLPATSISQPAASVVVPQDGDLLT